VSCLLEDAPRRVVISGTLNGIGLIASRSASSTSKNKFVHLALQRTLSLALEARGAGALQNSLSYGLDITIAGDNDFYSQRAQVSAPPPAHCALLLKRSYAQLAAKGLPPTLASLAQLPPFTPTGVQLADVHKTGLGSSAALITSLVSSLLVHLRVIPPDSFAGDTEGGTASASDGRKLAHNLAQYVHCLAQGKVGSGFDVSAAVFGSQLYTRFDPGVIAPLMFDDAAVKLHPTISPSNQEWNHRVEPFKLPPLTRLMLADVDAGSDTPSLVGKVLKWRKEDSETANDLWNALDKVNHAFSKTLLKLSDLHTQDTKAYTKAVKYLSTLQTVQWLVNPNISGGDQEIMEAFAEAHQYSEDVRAKMREMGTLSGVPIEPPEQTELLNACVSGAGVIGGGVPGAGGYDAIWLLVLDPETCPPEELPSARVERVWAAWKGLDVSPLSASESVAKGVRLEDVADVKGLKNLVDAPW